MKDERKTSSLDVMDGIETAGNRQLATGNCCIPPNQSPAKRWGSYVGFALRWLGLIVALAALFSHSPTLTWLAVAVLFLVWLTAFLSRCIFRWNADRLYELRIDSKDGEESATPLPGVTVIAPARNEENGIEPAVRSLAALDYPGLEVIVVNDHSTDGTRAILERVQRVHTGLRVFHDPPLREGWLGKANAVWFAVQQGDPENKWLLLTDADVVFHPKTLRRAVAHTEAAGLDYFTVVPVLDNGTLAEELMLPQTWRNLIVAASPRLLNNPNSPPLGIGAFTLVKREAYLQSGGHSAIHNRQPEDTLLGGVVKKWGGKIGAGWTSQMLRVRLYRGLRQVIGYTVRKNRAITSDSIISLLSTTAFWLLCYVLPLPLGVAALAAQVRNASFSLPLTLYGVMALAAYWHCTQGIRQAHSIAVMRPSVPWLHPLGALLRVWTLVLAAGQVLRKSDMDWRGRDFKIARAAGDRPAKKG